MDFRSVGEILDSVREKQRAIRRRFADATGPEIEEKTRLTLDYLTKYDEQFERIVTEAKARSDQQLSDITVRYSDEPPELRHLDDLIADENSTVAEIGEKIVQVNEELAKYFKRLSERGGPTPAKELFESLARIQYRKTTETAWTIVMADQY